MTIPEALTELDLFDKEFRAIQLADLLYPDARKCDTEGRVYNHAVPAVARRLRQIIGIEEIEHGLFYAHKEFF